MLGLTPSDLNQSILGCGDGPAAFNSHMAKAGKNVMSVDPLYQWSKEEIQAQIDATFTTIIDQVKKNTSSFVWNTISSPSELAAIRKKAMDDFLGDYIKGKKENRYLAGCLPNLPFTDQSFSLALCSHFLFLYSNQLSARFHLASIAELCRVAGEVRIFPVVDLKGTVSCHLQKVRSQLQARGLTTCLITVEYQFQKGGNQYLKITRG